MNNVQDAAIQLLELSDFPSHIIKEAEERCRIRRQNRIKDILKLYSDKLSNPILDSMMSVSGISRGTYLGQLYIVTPWGKTEVSPDGIVGKLIDKLEENTLSTESGVKIEHKACEIMHEIVRVSCFEPHIKLLTPFFIANARSLNKILAKYIDKSSTRATSEVITTLTTMARRYHFALRDGIEHVLSSAVKVISSSLAPWDIYLAKYREARDKHADLELAVGKQIPFNYPAVQFNIHEYNRPMVCYLYYGIADLLYQIPSYLLMDYYLSRMMRRDEAVKALAMLQVRPYIFHLNLVQQRAEEITNSPPYSEHRGKYFKAAVWDNVPEKIFDRVLKFATDRNKFVRNSVIEFLSILSINYKEKVPPIDEDFIKALESMPIGSAPEFAKRTEGKQPGKSEKADTKKQADAGFSFNIDGGQGGFSLTQLMQLSQMLEQKEEEVSENESIASSITMSVDFSALFNPKIDKT